MKSINDIQDTRQVLCIFFIYKDNHTKHY